MSTAREPALAVVPASNEDSDRNAIDNGRTKKFFCRRIAQVSPF